MILPDVNLLVYAYNTDAPWHQQARRWWEICLDGSQPVAIARVVALGFVRLMSSRAVMQRLILSSFCEAGALQSALRWPQTRNLDLSQGRSCLPEPAAADSAAALKGVDAPLARSIPHRALGKRHGQAANEGLRNGTGVTIRITGKFSVSPLANRSISISLEEGLLAQLDAQGSNRSALVSEALVQWLARRRIDALNAAYAHLASLESGDLAEAGDAAVAMGLSALTSEGDG